VPGWTEPNEAIVFVVAAIRLPPILRPEADGQRQLDVDASTIRGALSALVERYPALGARVFDGESVPPFLNVFVDGEDIRGLDGIETPVSPNATILLLPAVAGG
jgi:molybdopterin synthase sulfur carrier subunit